MKRNILIIFLIILNLLQSIILFNFWRHQEMPKIHILERPMQIATGFDNYSEYTILPAGTVLYNDSDSLNKRVAVYFNLQGVNFNFSEQEADILKQPSEISAIRSIDLPRVIKSIPLTKKDIFLIIKYDEDISESVRTMLYKKYKLEPTDFD